ncbi:MnhB domain-containing protein [Tautonia rosea]|uniref:MnhB domain-containing protein n=1 Tax=Tautonia rosea TaxID=2728037 RepID=UPI00147604DD|nr:MnhB domain-containing protein [Tautonia rosea]
MNSLIFREVTRAVYPAAIVFAIHLLIRGHDEPGGGFVAGLVLTMAVMLETLAFGAGAARRRYRLMLRPALGIGLAIALGSGLVPMIWGHPPFTFSQVKYTLPGDNELKLSGTLAFDVGVVLVIIGSMGTALVVMIGLKPTRTVP